MIKQTYSDIATDELMEGAILNEEYEGFKEDYLVLHCLLRKAAQDWHKEHGNVISKENRFSVFEIGCNMGTGTNIICNAIKDEVLYHTVYSLDLPTELAHTSLQHPISEGKGDRVGERCTFPFTLLRGDSLQFDYKKYPCEAYFCDGEHTEVNVTHETKQVLKCNPELVVFHDSDMPEVMAGILAGMGKTKKYKLYRVTGTRIAYLLRK